MVNLDNWAIEMQFTTGVWTDITEDVINKSVKGEYGIRDNGPTDRVASTGRMTFSLNNSESNSLGVSGLYSPGRATCRTGFTSGIPVRARFSGVGLTRTKFYGKIAPDGIKPAPGIYGERKTEVTVLDWMNQAATHELDLPAYTTNKRIEEIVALIVANMPLAPLSVSYAVGNDTFVSVFDTVKSNTRALSEFQKLALSEYGFIYVQPTETSDECLTVENRNAKITGVNLTNIPQESGCLQSEDVFCLLQENGDEILLDVGEPVTFVDTAIKPEISYGKHLANIVTATNYPRRYDTSATVLFEQQSYYTISAGGSITGYKGSYRDPLGAAQQVAGKNMITPVAGTAVFATTISFGTPNLIIDSAAGLAVFAAGATIDINCTGGTGAWNNGSWVVATAGAGTCAIGTAASGNKTFFAAAAGSATTITKDPSDYLMNSDSAGTGTNLTANLAVTATYGVSDVEYTLVNSATVDGYITKLQARGLGIYLYDPIDYKVEDTTSKLDNGSQSLTIDMAYQDQAITSKIVTDAELRNLKSPRQELDKWPFMANRNADNMAAFLSVKIGDRLHFTESQTGFNRDRFIDGIEWELIDGIALKCTWKTREPLTFGVWLVEVAGATELDLTTVLG